MGIETSLYVIAGVAALSVLIAAVPFKQAYGLSDSVAGALSTTSAYRSAHTASHRQSRASVRVTTEWSVGAIFGAALVPLLVVWLVIMTYILKVG